MKSLLLKFAGPLQSWGTSSHFETRHTDYYPSKSAVIGMIAAAFGYRRNEPHDADLMQLNELAFAVRIDQQGNLLKDYHIASKCKPTGEFDRNYVTNRYCLEDAVFLVALGSEDILLLEKIEQALAAPYFQLCLGRRSFPLSYDFIIGIQEEDPFALLRSHAWVAQKWQQKKIQSLNSTSDDSFIPIYADADLLVPYQSSIERPFVRKLRHDIAFSFSNKNRRFGCRYEARFDLPLKAICPMFDNTHDKKSASVNESIFDKDYVSMEHDAFSMLEVNNDVSQ
jgi:hypothetical protein